MKKIRSLFVVLSVLILSGCRSSHPVQRYGSVIGLKKEAMAEYTELHANAWPGVLQLLKESNIQNYSIYLTQMDDGEHYLFSYFEYAGSDFSSDMKSLSENSLIKKWWKLTDPMQQPLSTRKEGEHWKAMNEVFHME